MELERLDNAATGLREAGCSRSNPAAPVTAPAGSGGRACVAAGATVFAMGGLGDAILVGLAQELKGALVGASAGAAACGGCETMGACPWLLGKGVGVLVIIKAGRLELPCTVCDQASCACAERGAMATESILVPKRAPAIKGKETKRRAIRSVLLGIFFMEFILVVAST